MCHRAREFSCGGGPIRRPPTRKPREQRAPRGNHNNGAIPRMRRECAVPRTPGAVRALARTDCRTSGETRLPGSYRADWVGGGPPLCAPGSKLPGYWQLSLTALSRQAVFPRFPDPGLIEHPLGEGAGTQVAEDHRATDQREQDAPHWHVPKGRGQTARSPSDIYTMGLTRTAICSQRIWCSADQG